MWSKSNLSNYVSDKIFCGFDIPVGEGVYKPTWFTAEFIELIASNYTSDAVAVDMGSGSCNQSIVFASRVKNAKVYAVEPNPIAYEYTLANSTLFDLAPSQIIPLNIYAKDASNIITEPVDVVFSNPPCVPTNKQVGNSPLDYAIYGGVDGFDVIREIIDASAKLLKPKGALYLALSHTNKNIYDLFDDSWGAVEFVLPYRIRVVRK
jgi:release factor glutamine methyltransferase